LRFLTFEDRPSSSPFIERVWRCHSSSGGVFYSMAEGNFELVVTRLEGLTLVTLRGQRLGDPRFRECRGLRGKAGPGGRHRTGTHHTGCD
jgi:hypothetical protein